MKSTVKFIKIVFLTGCLVLLGLNAAAQGLEKMSPDISQGFLECSLNNQVMKVTALGEEYYLNYMGVLGKLKDLKNNGQQWLGQCKEFTVFWGGIFQETGRKYFPAILWQP